MLKAAPFTKLIFTVFVSVWAMLLQTVVSLSVLVGVQIVLLLLAGVLRKSLRAVLAILSFAGILAAIQLLAGMGLADSIASGLRMAAMTLVFVILMTTTRIQELTAALIKQCRVPYEYAFMFTSALRFIPDFLAESQAVREAQACRGFSPRGNVMKRLSSYVAILGPLVLRAVAKSETMAMSLELRGFGGKRTFSTNVALRIQDYFLLAAMLCLTIMVIFYRFPALFQNFVH